MGFFLGLLFGALGWTLFGPIGAILAAIWGFNFSKITSGGSNDGENIFTADGGKKRYNSNTSQGDFTVVLLILVATVMKADGKVTKGELDEVKKFLLQYFNGNEKACLDSLQTLKLILQQNYDYGPVCSQVRSRLNYSSKLELLHLMFKISSADGVVSSSEMSMLVDIAMKIGISPEDFHSIKAAYLAYNTRNSYSGNYNSGGSSSSSKKMSLDLAYQILEIDKNADEQQIKKAYRKMAMKYHPDKVNNLGEDVKKSATEKFKAVNEAYHTIKDAKGFS